MTERKTPWLALAALSFFTAYGLWQIAIRQPDPTRVQLIDLPQATPAALLTSGIDRQTLSEYLELKTSVQMGSAPSSSSPPVQIKTREKRDGHSRVPKIGQWVKVEISTYSRSYHGNGTHSGERYDHYKGHTAATTIIGKRWVLPRGSVWEVEYPAEKNIVLKPGMTIAYDFETGKTTRVITVRINDTGSWRPKRAPYWLDLSGAAWRDLTGIAPSRKVARMRRVR